MEQYPKPNEHGVFQLEDCEIVRWSGKGWELEVLVVQSGPGEWRSAYRYRTGYSGVGYHPSVRGLVYTVRDEAITQEIKCVRQMLEGAVHYAYENEKERIAEMLAAIGQKRQLRLF